MQSTSRIVVPEPKGGRSVHARSLNLGKYFRSTHVSGAFKFTAVTRWDSFEYVLTRNLERVTDFPPPSRFMTTQELALAVVTPLLARMGLSVTFVEGRPNAFPFIGNADLVLCESANVAGKPLLIGRNHSDLALEFDIASYLEGQRSTPSELSYFGGSLSDAELEKSEAARALQSLCHVMLVNDLAFGYLSSEACTRFVNIVPRCDGLELRVSDPVNSREACRALAAMSLEAYYGHPYLRYYRGFEVLAEALEDPNIEPLSSFEAASAGKIKWWVASRVNRQKYAVGIDHRAPSDVDPRNLGAYVPDDASAVCRFGVVTIDNARMLPSFLKICTDEVLVRREASMLQYLLEKGTSRVAKLILYAHMLENDFHLLCLEPFGRQLTSDDIVVPGVEEQMLAALDEVHAAGVRLVKITIESFGLEVKHSFGVLAPTVRIVSFTNAKLYRRIPEIVRQNEKSLLHEVIAAARSHALSSSA